MRNQRRSPGYLRMKMRRPRGKGTGVWCGGMGKKRGIRRCCGKGSEFANGRRRHRKNHGASVVKTGQRSAHPESRGKILSSIRKGGRGVRERSKERRGEDLSSREHSRRAQLLRHHRFTADCMGSFSSRRRQKRGERERRKKGQKDR